LSNSPEPWRFHSPARRKAVEASRFRSGSEAWSPNISEVLRRRDIAPKGGRRAVWGFIVFHPVGCQHLSPKLEPENSWLRSSRMAGLGPLAAGTKENEASPMHPDRSIFDKAGNPVRGPGHAALRPHSSAVLWVLVGGVSSGVVCAMATRSVTARRYPKSAETIGSYYR
jgi:hypothetical protein